MRKLIIFTLLLSFTTSVFAEITGWWGLVSFRERHEITKEYTDYTFQGEPGTLRYTDTNTKTRVGYQFGFLMDITDNLKAGLTFRSGIGSVMWQDISMAKGDDSGKLLPGVQEAYLDWNTPYANLQLGKIPQKGNAMWDLYACVNQTDWRLYDPRDGIFNDRISAVNGVRLKVPIELYEKVLTEYNGIKLPRPVTLSKLTITPRATYHVDYVGGYKRDHDDEQQDERNLDWYVALLGLKFQYSNPLLTYDLDTDYGLPYRLGDKYKQDDKDSIFVDESIWGMTHTLRSPILFNFLFQFDYARNERDSMFTASFWDYKAAFEYKGFRLSGRYQHGVQEHEFGNYIGSKAIRDAWHLYVNKTIWNLDIQPRVIWFRTNIDPPEPEITDVDYVDEIKKKQTNVRMEITATVRF